MDARFGCWNMLLYRVFMKESQGVSFGDSNLPQLPLRGQGLIIDRDNTAVITFPMWKLKYTWQLHSSSTSGYILIWCSPEVFSHSYLSNAPVESPIAKHSLPMSCMPEYTPSNIKLKTRKCSCSAPCEITDFIYPRPTSCSGRQCDAHLVRQLAQLTSGFTVTII